MPFKAAGTGKNMFDSEYFLKTPKKKGLYIERKGGAKAGGEFRRRERLKRAMGTMAWPSATVINRRKCLKGF